MEIVAPLKKFDTITLHEMGRRPTNINDIKGLLSLLDRSSDNFLEIGTWYGSTLFELARRFPTKTFHSVDFLEIELPYKCAMTTRASRQDIGKYAKDLPNVRLHYIESKEFEYGNKNIGLVFIDGNHSYEGVKLDTDKALEYFKKEKKSGIICWHDSNNNYFGVPKYLKTEIDSVFTRKFFKDSQVSYIRTGIIK
jgi:hypothetical protein